MFGQVRRFFGGKSATSFEAPSKTSNGVGHVDDEIENITATGAKELPAPVKMEIPAEMERPAKNITPEVDIYTPKAIIPVQTAKPIPVVTAKPIPVAVAKPILVTVPPPKTQSTLPPGGGDSKKPQSVPLTEKQVKNAAGGFSFKICDMQRLKRYLILGSEKNTYYSTATQATVQNIQCVQRLLAKKRYQEVLDTIEEFSVTGRVAKEDPILTILSMCASHADKDVRKAAYGKVATICNIPTKLFRFLDFTQTSIDEDRSKNPPEPQLNRKKRKLVEKIDDKLEEMQIDDSKPKEPSETIDTSLEPVVKKVKKKEKELSEYKKVNKTARKSSGWGRMRRKGVSKFYVDEKKDACRLLYLVTKYKQRHNWSHQQVLGYAHPKLAGENEQAKNLVLRYATRGYDKMSTELEKIASKPGVDENVSEVIQYMKVISEVNKLSPDKEGDKEKLLNILREYGVRSDPKQFTTLNFAHDGPETNIEKKKSSIHIVREHLPTAFLNSSEVWEAMLADMPMTAMIRNLGKMSSQGLFDKAENVKRVVDALGNVKRLKSARVHPMKILIAMQVYNAGHGDKGDLKWTVNKEIVKALDSAFYLSFKTPEIGENFKTNKKYMLCLDVSGSMSFAGCTGCELITPAMGSVAMAMVTWHIEDHVEIVAFGGHLVDMKGKLNKNMLIPDVMKVGRSINFGATDCSLPMVHAKQKNLDVDVFIVYTDSDTWAGRVHPMTALKDYNKFKNRGIHDQAKLIVCGMQSNGFTIADPNDPNALDIIGFDPSVPDLISEFAKGTFSSSCSEACDECYPPEN